MFAGKLLGAIFGLLAAGIPGLVIGLLVGHAFDRGLGKTLLMGSPANVQRIRESFFETTFLLCGHLAKADGRISRSEIDHTEDLIAQMRLDGGQRQRAIELFRRGAAPGFDVEGTVRRFIETCGTQRQLQQTLLLFLISLAHADQELSPAEHGALVRIAVAMGRGAAEVDRLLDMARAQWQFHQQGAGTSRGEGSLEAAYKALGVALDCNERDLKRAYRKLMSENHPDKLIAKGVPDSMVRLATERSQEIQAAYELIRKSGR